MRMWRGECGEGVRCDGNVVKGVWRGWWYLYWVCGGGGYSQSVSPICVKARLSTQVEAIVKDTHTKLHVH